MRRYIFNIAKKLLPRISETEKIALQSGTVSLDRDIMTGFVDQNIFNSLHNNEHQYITDNVNDICSELQNEPIFDGTVNQKVLDVLHTHKAFSYIIKKKYSGLDFPVET